MSSSDSNKTTGVKKGRGHKQRRVSSDSGEEIWSELAHAAFMEALVVYPPMGKLRLRYYQTPRPVITKANSGNLNSRPPKAFGRHQLIQSFIYNKTGKMRTTQQISSHIQRLKNIHRDNPSLMALLAPTSTFMPPSGAPDVDNRSDLPTAFCAAADRSALLGSDLAFNSPWGPFPLPSPQYNTLPDFAGLTPGPQSTQNASHNIDPTLQEDNPGTSLEKLSHFFDLEAQEFVQPTRIPDYSPLNLIIPPNTEYQGQARIPFLPDLPVPFTNQDSDSQGSQPLHFHHYATQAPITPDEQLLHAPLYPPEMFPLEKKKIVSMIDNDFQYNFNTCADLSLDSPRYYIDQSTYSPDSGHFTLATPLQEFVRFPLATRLHCLPRRLSYSHTVAMSSSPLTPGHNVPLMHPTPPCSEDDNRLAPNEDFLASPLSDDFDVLADCSC